MNATDTAPLTHSVECPLSGYTVTVEQDPHAPHWWSAHVHVDIGGSRDLFVNAACTGAASVVDRLRSSIDVVRWTLFTLRTGTGPSAYEERLDSLWHDLLSYQPS